jgi:hypothetical protein
VRRPGPLDAGDVEYLRKRLIFTVAQIAKELSRDVAEVAVTTFDLCAVSLRSRGLSSLALNHDDTLTSTNKTARTAHKTARRPRTASRKSLC